MNKYKLHSTPAFIRDLKKLKDRPTRQKAEETTLKLLNDPFDQSLRTHQVNIPDFGKVWSSRVTGDLRLIWILDENNELTIIALRLQGHDTVYS